MQKVGGKDPSERNIGKSGSLSVSTGYLEVTMSNALPHVVIVGAGFGGLEAARALANEPVRITLIDRHNYHLFQPLLYQVAIAGLVPSQLATAGQFQ